MKKQIVFDPPKKLFECTFCPNKFVHEFLRTSHEKKCKKYKKDSQRERYPSLGSSSEISVNTTVSENSVSTTISDSSV